MIHLAAKVVAAYLGKNTLAASEIPSLIQSTYSTLARLSSGQAEVKLVVPSQPFVSTGKSVTPEALICLDCGRKLKTLKRHINNAHGLSEAEYRAKWSLPSDYPMVAPNYAEHRSQLAISLGLGRKKQNDATTEPSLPTEKPQHRYPGSRWSKPAG